MRKCKLLNHTLFLLILFIPNFTLWAQKKTPVNPYINTTNTTGVVGCSIFTDPNNYTCNSSYTYPAGVNDFEYTTPINANTGCLLTTPNQVWFIVTINSVSSSTLTFTQTNSSNVDVDAAIWGPIQNNDLSNACLSVTNAPLSCDYRANAESIISISNPQVGQKYVMLVTNYSNSATNISITQPSGGNVQYCKANSSVTCSSVPTATLSGTQNICIGNSANLSIAFTGTGPWSYKLNNSSLTQTTSENPKTVSISPSSTTTYQLVSVQNNYCVGTVSGSATVTVKPKPTASISGTQSICIGSSATLSINFTGDGPWTYSVNNGTSATTNVSPISISVTPSSTTTYTVTSVSGACGTGTTSGSATVTVKPKPTASISGTQTSCSGVPVNLNISFTGDAPWSYAINNGTTNTTSTSPISVTVSPTITTSYRVTSVSNICGVGTSSDTAKVTIKSTATAILTTNKPSICEGDSSKLVLNFTGIPPWNYNIDLGVGSGTTSISPHYITVHSGGSYGITSFSDACGNGSFSGTALITVKHKPTLNLSLLGSSSICKGDSTTIQLSFIGTSPWTYTMNNGLGTKITSTNPILLKVAPTASTSYTATSVSNECGTGTVTGNIPITVRQKATVSITGDSVICVGDTVRAILSFTGTSPWFIASNWAGTASISQTPYTYKFTPNTSTFYDITSVSNSCGSGTVLKSKLNVVVKPKPTATLSGNATIPSGQTTNLTVAFTGEAPWIYTINNGIGTDTAYTSPIQIPISPTVSTVYELMNVRNICGTGTVSGSATIQICQRPTATLSANVNLCKGASAPLVITFTGASPWTYTIDNGIGTKTTNINPATLYANPTDSTIYHLTSITNSCASGTFSGNGIINVIDKGEAILSYVSTVDTICAGQNVNLKIDFKGIPPYTYNINNNFKFGSSNTTPIIVPITVYGSFSLISVYKLTSATDYCGMSILKDSAVVKSYPYTQVIMTGGGNIDYADDSLDIRLSLKGKMPWTYTFDNIYYTSYDSVKIYRVSPQQTQTYYVTSLRDNCGNTSTAPGVKVTVCRRPIVGIVGHTNIITTSDYALIPFTGKFVDANSYIRWNDGVASLYNIYNQTPYRYVPTNKLFAIDSVYNYCGNGKVLDGSVYVRNINQLDRKIITCFDFDNNTNDSKNNNNGTVYGNPTPTTNRVNLPNHSFYFNGLDDYVRFDNNLLKLEKFTISMWVLNQNNNLSGRRYLLNVSGLRSIWSENSTTDTTTFRWYYGEKYDYSSIEKTLYTKTFEFNKWNHIVYTRINGILKMYVDGELVLSYNNFSTPYTNLGSNSIGSNSGINFFKGKIDDIKFFNTVLSEEEIKTLYYTDNCEFEYDSNRDRELIACYPFTNNANDAIKSNNGTTFNTTLTTDKNNIANKAYNFNGTTSYISLPDTTIPRHLVEYTLAAWVRPNILPTGSNLSTILSIGGASQVQNIALNSSGNVVFKSSGQNYRGVSPLITTTTVNINQWSHIIAIRTANEDLIYINGQLSAKQEHIASVDYTSFPKIRIGVDVNNNNYFSGKIDEVKIIKGALYDAEAKALYQSTTCSLILCPPITTQNSPTNSSVTLGASKALYSSSKLNALPVEYKSGGSIILTPGFETTNGNYFKAQISGCPN